MGIAKILFMTALFFSGVCWLGNVLSLFAKPHKRCELLIFFQLVWVILGLVGLEYFVPATELQWYLGTYGYPILLWPVQIWSQHKFFPYTKSKHNKMKNICIWLLHRLLQ